MCLTQNSYTGQRENGGGCMSKVTITIDGMQISADEGMTVLEAAQAHGFY
ncbi:MAG: (2Fe-2S)-binding protein, partial [Desulfofustis sp.]|nr:(2Fe-2S)-binding protein [Desulfofustis sp.]